MKICSRCGNNLTWNRSFCPLCGGLIVERPDDAAAGYSVDPVPRPARPEPVPAVQPEQTPPPESNTEQQQAEPVGIPTLDSAMPPAVPDVPPVPQEQPADYSMASQPAQPIYNPPGAVPPDPYVAQIPQPEAVLPAFEMPAQAEPQQTARTEGPVGFPPPDGIYGDIARARQDPSQMPLSSVPDAAPQPDELPPLPGFREEVTEGASQGAYPGVHLAQHQQDLPEEANLPPVPRPQPKPAAPAPFLGIMKGSSSGRVEWPTPKAHQEPQPDDGAFERLAPREEIKAYPAGAPNVDMFSRKRESLMPQPEATEAGPARDGLKPGIADSQRVVGFTPPVHAPGMAVEPVQTASPLPHAEVPPRLFTEAAEQPPVPSVETGTISLGSAMTPPTAPQVPIMQIE
ncbi:MAG: hypothetical protein LBL73_06690, partial [Synergistaceae bacterium]|nr:hypothetical protein [Synergistaceae bacterium]